MRLDLLAAGRGRARAAQPAERHLPTDLDESLVHGVPSTIERAVANLLDNAAKWSPPGGEVEVGVRGGEVTVRDHGPGIADEDLPYVFDRFYRAPSARGLPGSGLGLAIVQPGRRGARRHGRRRARRGRRHADAPAPQRRNRPLSGAFRSATRVGAVIARAFRRIYLPPLPRRVWLLEGRAS